MYWRNYSRRSRSAGPAVRQAAFRARPGGPGWHHKSCRRSGTVFRDSPRRISFPWRPASGVHEQAAFGAELFHGGHFRAECRDDHDVVLAQIFDLRVLLLAGKELNAHRANLIVDLGVMDDFTQDVDRLIGINLARGVSQ